MAKPKPIYDVFISHSHRDAKVAAKIARVLESYKLTVFTLDSIKSGQRIEDSIWEALAESQAFVALLSKVKSTSDWLSFELGAAKAWNKPIYAVAPKMPAHIPAGLRGTMVYPVSRLKEIAHEIKGASELGEEEQATLINLYHQTGVTVDQLILQPKQLLRLTKQFRDHTKKKIASEEIMRVLLRLRKRGSLRPPKAR